MADQLQDIVQRMVAGGESEADIALVIQNFKPPTAAEKPVAPAPKAQGLLDRLLADNPALPALLRGTQGALRLARENPVQAGALTGGILAAPLTGAASIPAAMAASGLGAAGGAGLGITARQLDRGVPESAANTAKTMALEGAAGAAGEGMGGLLAKGLKTGAHRLYRGVLRPSTPLQREFGDIAAAGLKEGITVSERGARVADTALGESAAKAKDLVAKAAPTASKIRAVTEVGSEVKPLIQRAKVRARTGLPDESGDIADRVRTLSRQNRGGIGLDDAQAMKGELQDLAGSVYRAQDKGTPVLDLSADTNAALARGLRKGIEARVPEVGPVNARTQGLIGLKHALENANARNVSIGIKSLIGDMTPGLISGVAIGGDRAAGVPFNDALKTALIAALGGQDE